MGNKKICILDYGSGNVRSVYNIFLALAGDTVVSNSPGDIMDSTHIILPGVGSFGASMDKIKGKIPLGILKREIFEKKKPFLGICVGMQVLADKGYEFGEHEGLGWVPGEVVKLETGNFPLPHIGWNNINKKKNDNLFRGMNDNQDFYFVHSYVFRVKEAENVIAETEYGDNFCSVIKKKNIYGVQFHPEKSQKAGQLLLKNFIEMT